MKIAKLVISNFLTISDATLELDDRGLLLIQGTNNDDPSAESNGAGKSSIVDALCWGLYGTTARGLSGDAVVNNVAKKDCCVHITLTDEVAGKTYRVVRWRKSGAYKNQVFVYEKDDVTGAEVDLSKGTDKETQEVINRIMGCGLDVFSAAVYAGQEKMPDLPGMTDKMLKTLIEEAAGVEVLTEAYTAARGKWNLAKAVLDSLAAQRAVAVNNDTRLKTELAGLEINSKTFEDGRRQRAKDELGKVLPINAEIANREADLASVDESAVKTELADCQAKLDANKAEVAEFNRLNTEQGLAEKNLAALRSTLLLKKRDLEQLEEGLKNIEAQIGKPCGECGKTYCEHDLEAARQARQEAIRALKQSMVPMAQDARAAQEKVTAASEAVLKFKAGMTDVSAVAQRQRELTNLLSGISAIKSKVELLKQQIGQIKAAANAKLTEANPWTKAIESKQVEIKRNEEHIANLTEQVNEKGAEVELLADAVKVFGPAGVRAHILDTVTPYLNDRTQDYLGALSDGSIHAVWATLSKTAKGELKERFNIDVTNDRGGDSFAALSGGEKRKVRLATALALQDLVASRAAKPIGLFAADEIDHALDEPGLERLMGVLERKARERGTVLVISHNSLSDWIDNVITVTKTARGKSTVAGATVRGF